MNTKKNLKSFSLVELLIAGSLFVMFLGGITMIYLQVLKNHRFLVSVAEVSDDIGFVIERMNREIRMGKNFSITNQNTQLRFINEKDQSVVYRLNNNAIERSEDGGASFERITGDNVVVETLKFHGQGLLDSDNQQPRITILLKFRSKKAQKASEKYSAIVQTTVSSRLLQIP